MTRKTLLLVATLWIGILLANLLVGYAPLRSPTTPQAPSQEVTLTLGSWRPDDVEQMNRILDRFSQRHPHITIRFDATDPPQYNAALSRQMESGAGPDLFYLRSYSVSRQLYEKGYLELLDDLPGLKENFSPDMLAPWSTDDGRPYGVPFIATAHGIYYNQDIFEQLNLTMPDSWQELLRVAEIIRDKGYIPFANASGDRWTMGELVFMNIAPNFIGGREGRQAYLNGQRCFNDAHMVAAFRAVKDLAPFLPPNQALLTYHDSQQLFLQGMAAMWLGGSWDIAFFEAQKPAFAWSVFAVPPPAGQPTYVTFQLDAGVGLNAASVHKAEARLFLEWLTSQELAEALGNELPGFFPMHHQMPTLENEHANTFLAMTRQYDTDVRFVWEKLMDGSPSAYDLVQEGAIAVILGQQTPQQAADALQAGLSEWFEPARSCKR